MTGPTGAGLLVRRVRREPPAYPTAVVTTPGSFQKSFSSPQKQPSPKTAVFVPSGHGPAIGVPRMVWMPGSTIGSERPGRASAAVGIDLGLELKNCMPGV